MTPFDAARMISGCATFSADCAAAASPAAIASSTLRIKVRIRDRRAVLTVVRRSIFRTIFFADDVFAINDVSAIGAPTARKSCGMSAARQMKDAMFIERGRTRQPNSLLTCA